MFNEVHDYDAPVADPAIGVGAGCPPRPPTKNHVAPPWTEILKYTWITAIAILWDVVKVRQNGMPAIIDDERRSSSGCEGPVQ